MPLPGLLSSPIGSRCRLNTMLLLLLLDLFPPLRNPHRRHEMPLLLPNLLDSLQVAPRPQGV